MKDLSTKENTIHKGYYCFFARQKAVFQRLSTFLKVYFQKKQTIKEKQEQLQTLRQTYQSQIIRGDMRLPIAPPLARAYP